MAANTANAFQACAVINEELRRKDCMHKMAPLSSWLRFLISAFEKEGRKFLLCNVSFKVV
jgi:hypothetical protein